MLSSDVLKSELDKVLEYESKTTYERQTVILPLGLWQHTLLHLQRSIAERDAWAVRNMELQLEIDRLRGGGDAD